MKRIRLHRNMAAPMTALALSTLVGCGVTDPGPEGGASDSPPMEITCAEAEAYVADCMGHGVVQLDSCDAERAGAIAALSCDEINDQAGKADSLVGGVSADYALQPVDDETHLLLLSALTEAGVPFEFDPLRVEDARFVLHDTAGISSDSFYEELVKDGRGPLGHGPGLFIHQDGDTFVPRPEMFDARRPPATYHERGSDILKLEEAAELARALWAITAPEAHHRAFTLAFDGLELTADEIDTELEKAESQLRADEGRLYTTATWGVDRLCELVTLELDGKGTGVDFVVFPEQGETATALCAELTPYLTARNERIGKALNVELIQVRGSDCFSQDRLPLEPYTDAQYKQAALRYLQAALKAGFLPEVTTHFWDDRAFWGHCDPRCFDLDRLYGLIGEQLGHPPGAQYGLTARYGTRYGRDTIWWHTEVCGPKP